LALPPQWSEGKGCSRRELGIAPVMEASGIHDFRDDATVNPYRKGWSLVGLGACKRDEGLALR